jgi:hypothetical protein
MRIIIETETPDESRTMFRVLLDAKVVGEGLTAVQAQLVAGESSSAWCFRERSQPCVWFRWERRDDRLTHRFYDRPFDCDLRMPRVPRAALQSRQELKLCRLVPLGTAARRRLGFVSVLTGSESGPMVEADRPSRRSRCLQPPAADAASMLARPDSALPIGQLPVNISRHDAHLPRHHHVQIPARERRVEGLHR